MKKGKIIEKYGQTAYNKMLQQTKDRYKEYPECVKDQNREWRKSNPESVIAKNREISRKGGKYYEHQLIYRQTGLQAGKIRIRLKHGLLYRPFKQIIAPESQIHHQWVPGTANYTGVALVETDQHMHGFINAIQILEGEITLLTEAEIRGVVS